MKKNLYLNVVCLLVVGILFLIASVDAEVYVNRQWDEDLQQFRVQWLRLAGGGVTLDRGYQNGYGEYHKLQPGPPFIFESGVSVFDSITPMGEVRKSYFRIVNGYPDPMNPFSIVFNLPPEGGGWSIGGEFQMQGFSLEPIVLEGDFKITFHGAQGYAPLVESRRNSALITDCIFRLPSTDAGVPLEFAGGDVTMERCTFEAFADRPQIFTYHDLIGFTPFYNFTMRNCTFRLNDTYFSQPIQLDHLKSVTIENNTFENNTFYETDFSSIIEIWDSGIKSIKGNVASNNTVNAFRVSGESFVCDSGHIKSSRTLPIVASTILVDRGDTATIDSGSVMKFFGGGGGFVNRGCDTSYFGRHWLSS